MKRIVIFASGSGTNAENIIKYFRKKGNAEVVMVLSNRKEAKVLEKANNHNISALYFNKTSFYNTDYILALIEAAKPDLIVLAGFLLKLPENILNKFKNKIINIHPALLPKYGGKGMYGMNVHNAVAEHKEKETGITIHFVNEHYDEGKVIFQARTPVKNSDSPEDIAKKVHILEYEHFPKIIEKLLYE